MEDSIDVIKKFGQELTDENLNELLGLSLDELQKKLDSINGIILNDNIHICKLISNSIYGNFGSEDERYSLLMQRMYNHRDYINLLFGRTNHIERDDHKGFDYDHLIYDLKKYLYF